MDDNDLPSKDKEKLIELWQQECGLWNISLEGYHKKDLKGNKLTGSERLLTIDTQLHICIIFARKSNRKCEVAIAKFSSSVLECMIHTKDAGKSCRQKFHRVYRTHQSHPC